MGEIFCDKMQVAKVVIFLLNRGLYMDLIKK